MAIAVLGASSLLGKSLIKHLATLGYDEELIVAIDDPREDDNNTLEIAEKQYEIISPADCNWADWQVIVGCRSDLVSEYSDDIIALGGLLVNATPVDIIGASPTLAMTDSDWIGAQGAYQLPHASVLMLTSILSRIENEVGLERVDITAIMSVSDQDQAGVDELAGQTARLLNGLPVENEVYQKQIAFNLLANSQQMNSPAQAIENELPLVFRDSSPLINAHSVTAPVFYGAMAFVSLKTLGELSVAECVDIWRELPLVEVEFENVVTLVTDLNLHPNVCITELRQAAEQPRELKFCVQADAMNASVVPYLGKLIQRISGF